MGWKVMVKGFVGPILILSCWPLAIAQSDSREDIKSLASAMEKRFEACPRREIVAQFDRKHRKQVWQKQAWGPPTDVLADAKKNDENSVLYPYILTIEFSLKTTFGPERQSKSDAEKDSDLSPLEGVPAMLLTGRNRNTYLAGKDGVRLKKTEVLEQKVDGTPGEWRERPRWPDACWDQITIRE